MKSTKFFKLIFSKAAIVALAILLQVGVVSLAVVFFYEYYLIFQVISAVLGVLALISIINARSMPEIKLPWALIVCIFPVFGLTLYFLFSQNKLSRKLRRKHNSLAKEYLNTCTLCQETFSGKLPQYLISVANAPAFCDTAVTYFPFGEEMFVSLLADLRRAERFIFLEFFIIEPGKMWNSILEILREKAANGVDVRVLYDDIGCASHLKNNYYQKLRKMGISAHKFNPFVPVITGIHNNRDHRKIVVIDGEIAYTGGVNLADEYINEKHPFGKWKDSAVRIEGSAVNNFTVLFLENYVMTTGEKEDLSPYLLAKPKFGETGIVQPFGDGPPPVYKDLIAENVFLQLIENATKFIYITTPYLIIDYALRRALIAAAKRGVTVCIITPGIPDKRVIFAITRSHYPELLKAGVRIYEYSPGFIHSKLLIADGKTAFCGTVNFDYRSLVHHFECGALFYEHPVITSIKDDFEKTLLECREIDKHFKQNPFVAFFCALSAIFAPLL